MNGDPNPAGDPIEALLADLVARPEADQGRALAALCDERPPLAEELRARFAMFRRLARLTPLASLERLGDYELIRELGRGGMGVVYLASQRRGDQERQVALKLVRDRGLFSPEARARLQREGAAVFRLDHPSICSVLDAGEVDGTPYLAMRYVPGRTLAEHIAAAQQRGASLQLPASSWVDSSSGTTHRGLADYVAAVAAMGEQVAGALHAAHEAGFVHRDVKPGNVMIGTDGCPVLLDFGLVLDESQGADRLTMTGQPLGTPAYMSPEQISPARRPTDRTTDVYSLGATLYEALALRPPFEGRTREELFLRILNENPALLHRIARVPRDLAVVIQTALDKDPRRRYATAQDMAEDLRRVRYSQPILAQPPGLLRRLRLWIQRNRLAAIILALLVVSQLAIVALAISSDRRATAARLAEASAVGSFQAARDAVGELTTMAREHLTDVPWLEPVRRELFEKALAFHRQFLIEHGEDPALLLDAAVARRESAALHIQLGDTERALQLASGAMATLRELAAAGAARVLDHLARSHFILALAHERNGDVVHAEEQLLAAAELWRSRHERDSDSRLAMGQVLRRLGALRVKVGQLGGARQAIDEALAVLSTRPTRDQQLELTGALMARARLDSRSGDHEAADRDLERAAIVLRAALEERPRDRRVMSLLGINRLEHGRILAELQRSGEAEQAYREALERFEVLAGAFPELLSPRINLATVLNNLANLTEAADRLAESIELTRRSIEVLEGVARQDPSLGEARVRLASNYYNLGNHVRSTAPEEAASHFRRALAQLEPLLRDEPDVVEHLEVAGRAARNLGILLAVRGDDDGAAAAMGRAREFSEELVRRRPDNPRFLFGLGLQLFNEGAHLAELARYDLAARRLREAAELRRKLAADRPRSARRQADLLKTTVRLGQVEDLLGADSLPVWRDALAWIDGLSEPVRAALAGNVGANYDMLSVRHGLGAARLAAGEPAEALTQLTAAGDAFIAEDEDADTAVVRGELLLCQLHLAEAYHANGSDSVGEPARLAATAAANLDADQLHSRLMAARLRVALPRLEALLAELGVDPAAVAALRDALDR